MSTNSHHAPAASHASTSLGGFLRDRRERLAPDPNTTARRRTPGLRREEVAARAGVSVTWYTWLEQGRGGAPSADVLERLAQALELDTTAREFLYLLAQKPAPRTSPTFEVPEWLQGVLDAMPYAAALLKDPCWNIVGWNEAACRVIVDYATVPLRDRNVLRRMFLSKQMKDMLPDWEEEARFALEVFRIDVARMPDSPEVAALVSELSEASEPFRRFWSETAVRSHWAGVKRIAHPVVGPITIRYSSFAVEGAEGLTMIIYTPVTPEDAHLIESFLKAE